MESQFYSFLPESLRADVRRFDGGDPLEIADFLGSLGLSRGEVMVAFVEIFGYSPNKAKEVVLGWGSAQQSANEVQSSNRKCECDSLITHGSFGASGD